MANYKKKKSMSEVKPQTQEKYLFYMLPAIVNVKEFQEKLPAELEKNSDIWGAINVMEFQLSNGNMVYFEQLDSDSWEGSDEEFLVSKQIQMVYGVIFDELDKEAVWPYFQHLVEVYGGFLCEDSEDFQPIYIA